ncbi:trigger factor [Thermoflexus sp.]|uniref:trigger factor n=1 Tax=Thermoflexus sp. TaxID=1969742 RepID=UPI0025ED17F0|nr:trigger factor [Thermoflexus sp.]MDW8181650.1 trigger factor [Anaerolineae bacterium]MCS6963875.1 trigger factor [Thermoflexus sp.]MCS7352189.1 trigger factor [Thermoflexus sp.]MCX7691355.1 trigger factor [Thermoflexus sp.]MDW8186035.1 trigger factor [Anaerolineae bacterium]
MRITTENLPQRQVVLTIEVDPERVEKAMRQVARRFAERYDIPGFRRGKAPYEIVVRTFGREAIFEEAVEILSQEVYREALDQLGLDPYGPGRLERVDPEPLTFRVIVPLKPEVRLGDYRSLRLPYEPPEPTEEEVMEVLERLRRDHAIIEPLSEGVAEPGMMVTVALRASDAEGKVVLEDEFSFVLGQEEPPLPGLEERIAGMAVNETRTFELPWPGDKPRVLHAEATLIGISRYLLPDLDDALAQTIGDFETLEELKAKIRQDLVAHKRRQYDSEYAERALETLVDQAEVAFPPQMLEEEINELVEDLENFLRRRGKDLESYLKERNQTLEALREEFRPQAERRIRRGLVLYQLAQEEGLSVPEEVVEQEAQTLRRRVQASEEAWKHLGPEVSATVRSRLLARRALERLVEIARGDLGITVKAEPAGEAEAPVVEGASASETFE